MDGNRFDQLTRLGVRGFLRRDLLKALAGGAAAAAGAGLLAREEVDAKKKNCGVCKKRNKNGKCRNVKNGTDCGNGGTCRKGKCQTQPAPICPADRPAACQGGGCCPSNFSKCCETLQADGSKTCNPTAYTCCAANLGGGSCPPNNPQCCPPVSTDPFSAVCAAATDRCCTEAQGGGSCPAATPVCCAATTNVPKHCCQTGQACCDVAAGIVCPTGSTCTAGCCVAGMPQAAGKARVVRQRAHPRFYRLAR